MSAVTLLLAAALVLPQSELHGHGAHDAHGHGADAPPDATVPDVPRTPLGDRILRAQPGDTLWLAAGVHQGPIVVDRAVVLRGEPGAVIDGRGLTTVVTMTGGGAALVGVTVRNGGRSLDRDEAGVKLIECHGCTVRDVTVEEALHGIYVLSSNDVLLEGNTVTGDAGVEEARRGNGIHLFGSTGTRIRGNRVSGTRDGIYFSFTSGSDVAGNVVSGVRYGLHYMYSDDNRFTGNRFTRNAAGAAIMFSRRILFEDNLFTEHVGYRAYGILLQTSDDIEARRNRIEGNLVGVFMDNASRNLFHENAIVGNGTGIEFIPSAEYNTFTANAIVANRTAVRVAVAGGTNAFAHEGRGNYWGARATFDLDGDGIGDRPYRASDPFGALAAKRPVLEAFARTPAAQALSWAEQAFPVFDLPHVEDPFPLTAAPPGVPLLPATESHGRPATAGLLLLLVPAAAVAAARTLYTRKGTR